MNESVNQCSADNLVSAEGMRQHVATTRPQHVHFLTHVVLQLIKVHLRSPHLCLHLYRRTHACTVCVLDCTARQFLILDVYEREKVRHGGVIIYAQLSFRGIKIKSTVWSKYNYTTFILLRNSSS